jgi:two-component system KDP operon response regulator KdpE
MQHEVGADNRIAAVAVLSSEPRLRRFLRVALEADGQRVLEWADPASASRDEVKAVVVDLDSLGWSPPAAVRAISTVGIGAATPLLLISVYPLEPNGITSDPARRLAYLQPPFGPDVLVERVRWLLQDQRTNL